MLVGSSAGGWRALALACPDPESAHRELEDGYVNQVVPRGASPLEISAAYRAMLSRLLTPVRTAHLLRATEFDVGLHVTRARGPAGSSQRHVQAAAMAHSAAQGWSGKAHRRLGLGWVVRRHTIEYHLPASAGDHILVRTWVVTMKKVTSIRRYHILRLADDELLATAETKWAFIDYATGRPARILAEVAGAFQIVQEP